MISIVRSSSLGAALVVSAVLIGSGCGDESQGDVTTACDRLVDLGVAVKSIGSASTIEDVETALAGPLAAFVDAAEASGDEQLAEFAQTYASRFDVYLGGGPDATAAGEDANVALDRAGGRCLDLGAVDSVPLNS